MRRILSVVAVTFGGATLAVVAAGVTMLAVPRVFAAAPPAAGVPPEAWSWGLIAAAVCVCVSSLGAAFAVTRVGTAAVGALAEKPELFGRLLIFLGLAEGIAIDGLIVSILVLDRLG